jgi:hypothetical protein
MKIEKAFAWSLVFKMTVCTIMLVFLMVYYFHASVSCAAVPRYWILGLLLLPGILVSFAIRRQVLKDRTRKWSPWLFGIESLFTWWVSFAYFSGPMHDIALDYFGHHGRFGDVQLNGSSPYVVNDITLPFILFVPPFLIGTAYFIKRHFKR